MLESTQGQKKAGLALLQPSLCAALHPREIRRRRQLCSVTVSAMDGELSNAISRRRPVEALKAYTAPLHSRMRSALGLIGPGFITGAADDDPCAIGTYASTGARFGFSMLWIAPLMFPMMAASVYLCSKIGMVSGMGLSGVIRNYYSRWVLYPILAALLIANVIGAAADIGAVAAAVHLIVPLPTAAITVLVMLVILAIQTWGSYEQLKKIFSWLALALFSYVGAALLAKPDLGSVLWGTFRPRLEFNVNSLAMLVAVVGTSLSPYLFFWQASQEVEEEISIGRQHVWQRRGASREEMGYAATDVSVGMFFASLIMYFIILCTAATLFRSGQNQIDSAYAAAQALRPLAGNAASLLFAAGVVGVGILAVPVLTTGPAYALAEAFDWKHSLNHHPGNAIEFYAVILVASVAAVALNFVGINPMHALFWAGVTEGLLAPPLMVLIMLITNRREIMGEHVNGRGLNILGWATTGVITAAAVGLVWMWVR
jgi:NRAMP (natural resistance-associated macrophage protein)-like metal ion transporter